MELWSDAAQDCLLVGNYNSATVILDSLESPAVSRLQSTVRKINIYLPKYSVHRRQFVTFNYVSFDF